MLLTTMCCYLLSNIEEEEVLYQPHSSYHTYQDIDLNPHTLANLAYSDAFKVKDQQLLSWLYKHKKPIMYLTTHLIYKCLKDYLKKHRNGVVRGNKLLKHYKLINTSLNNFIFCIEPEKGGKKYWIKIAGPHRFRQLNIDLKEMISSHAGQMSMRTMPTYQSASRFARYLLYQKWKQNNHDVPLKVPTTYLFSYSPTGLIDDQHCLIIEEDFPHTQDTNTIIEALSAIKAEVKDFIIHLGLWDLHISQFVLTFDGDVVCIDLEDVDNSNTYNFFNKDYEKIKKYINFGLETFDKMICYKKEGL